MAGVKGKSGAPGKTRPAGPGRMPQTFTLQAGGQYGISTKTVSGGFSMEGAKVVEVDRKAITLELENGDRLTIFR